MITPWLTLAIVAMCMIAEAARAGRNESRQRSLGGIEPPGDVYKVMQLVYPAAFVVMIGEGLWRGASAADSTWVAGAVVFVLAKALKWWAIASLGGSWTFRVIVVPGMTRVASGPYRFMSHPNYVAVVGELAGVALLTGARLSGPLMTLAFGLLMVKRVAIERRALDAILPRR
jgi:methyltransferase